MASIDDLIDAEAQKYKAAAGSGGQAGTAAQTNPFAEKSDADPNAPMSLGGFGQNVLSSAGNFAGGLWNTFMHPINTVEGLGTAAIGAGANLLPQSVVPQSGWVHDIAQPTANAVGKVYKDRYGGWQNIKNTAYKDPVGLLADVSGVASGAGGLLGLGADAADAANAANVASKIRTAADVAKTAGEVTNPVSIAKVPGLLVRKGAATTIPSVLNPAEQDAADWAINQPGAVGQNVDAALVTGSPALHTLRSYAQRIPWSGAPKAIRNQVTAASNWLSDVGANWLPGQTTTLAGAGADVKNAIGNQAADYTSQVDSLRNGIRARAAANPQTITYRGATFPDGSFTPVTKTFEGPVETSAVRAAANDWYDKVAGSMKEWQRQQHPVVQVLDQMRNLPDYINLEDATNNREALGKLAAQERLANVPGTATFGAKVAGQLRAPLDDSIRTTIAGLGPGALSDWDESNRLTAAKHQMLKDVPKQALGSIDPTTAANIALKPEDAGIKTLLAMQTHTPQVIPNIKRAFIESLNQPIVADGDLKSIQTSINRLDKLGDQTKSILFQPGEEDELRNALTWARMVKQNANPSGSGSTLASAMMMKGLLTDPVRTGATLLGSRAATRQIFSPEVARRIAAGGPVVQIPQPGLIGRSIGRVVNPRTFNAATRMNEAQSQPDFVLSISK